MLDISEVTLQGTEQNIRDAPSNETHSDQAKRDNVDEWKKPTVNTLNRGFHSRFDSQIILQLEDDPVVMEAAARLVSKHPDRSVLFQLDVQGNYHLVYGNPRMLAGNLRWQVVGHGHSVEGELNHQTLAGYNPAELAESIRQFSSKLKTVYGIDSDPNYISLVGCSLTDYHLQTGGYARQFALSLDAIGLRADVAARRTDVSINRLGQKATLGDDGVMYHKMSDDKLVLTWNKQDVLVPASDLAERLVRAIVLVDKLASGKLKFSALDEQQYFDLADSFHREEGILDIEQLILTTFDDKHYQAWRYDLHQLLQLQDSYIQLQGFSGQKALHQSKGWNTSQASSIAAWQRVSMENHTPGIAIQTRVTPQGLFIGDNSLHALSAATEIGLGWLNARTLGDPQTQDFLNALMTHAMINEQRAEGALSDIDASQLNNFRQKFANLRSIDLSNQDIFTPIEGISSDSEGEYLLKGAHNVLMLSSRYQGQQHIYSLYDPYVGEVNISSTNAENNGKVINTLLQTYLAGLHHPLDNQRTRGQHYGMIQQGELFMFEATYKINMNKARQHYPALTIFQTFLSDFHSEQQQLAGASNITLNGVTLPARVLSKMGATLAGKAFSPMYGSTEITLTSPLQFDSERLCHYLSQTDKIAVAQAVLFLKQQLTLLENVNYLLTPQSDPAAGTVATRLLNEINQQVEGAQIKPALWSELQKIPRRWRRVTQFNNRVGTGLQGYGYLRGFYDLKKYREMLKGDVLTQQQKDDLAFEEKLAIASFSSNFAIDIAQYGLGRLGYSLANTAISGSRLGQIGTSAGFKMVRFGGPLLGGMSSGFDLYQATRSFKALDTTSDLKIQQDLMVNGSLSLMGAAVGIGTAISFALGGTAATVAGPVGLIVGAGIILGGEIYSSVRQIENIGQYVHLTPMETLHNGWRVFTGQGADPEIENRVAYIKTRETVRQQYSRLLVEQSQKILQSNGQINILYTSLGEVEVEGHPYKKIVAKDLAGREHVIRDHILPSEDIQAMISRALTEYLGQYSLGQHPLILDKPRVVPSEYHYYTPKRLLHTDDTINNSELSINVVMTTFSAQSQRVGQFIDQDGASLNKHMEANYHSVMGDFNGDGRRDIGYFTAQRLYLLLSNINGSYTEAPPIDYNSGEVPTTARYLIGDINNDDRDDIILIMDDEERIDILFIQEGGGFVRQHIAIQDEGEIRVSAPLQATPVLADINGDGYADWVSFTRSDVNINYGGSEGTFSTGISASLAALHKGDASQYIHHMTGDIDGDSCDDIVSLTKNGRLHILLGVNKNQRRVPFKKGSEQSYASVTALLADFNPEQIQLADIDGDGRADLVVIQNDGRYTLCHGRQNGRFGPVTDDTQREERGQRVAYRPNRLAVRGEQQILGITLDRDDKPALFSLNQAGIVFTHTLSAIPIQETITDVRLGGGNDVVKGNQDQKYSFEMEEGTKNFSGGRYADRFLLMGKPAPHQPSVLDGGEDPTSTDQHDTVIAVARPAENDGYIINLNTGTVSYTSNHKKIIANLLHIEHAQGHSETNDILRGNEDDNLLNGVGGKDSLFGEGGNDILMLQAGIALGGTGTDSYRILQNNRPENAMVTVFEAPDTQEISNVLLDYTAEQIVSVSHKEGFVLLTLRNDNSTLTTLGLYGMYSDPKEDPLTHQPGAYHTLADKPFSSNAFTDKSARKKRSRQHNFLLYTRDGFMISGWPQQLMPPSDDSEPLLPRLAARYKPEWDRNWQKLTQRSKPADIQVHLSTQNEQGKITINIAGREVRANLLPSFMQLIIAETPFNDRLEGDDTNNRLQSAQGNDILIGKGGSDHYVIEHKKPGRQITINNYDDTIGDLLPQDTLALPLSIKDIHLQQEANDIILSYRDMPTLYPTVRITNFMQDVRYRHISVQDENDTLLPLVRNNAGNLSLGRLEITAGDDVAIVYHESALLNALVNDQLNLLAGDDIFIDLTNNSNYTLIGGKGNDTLLGGGGDNTYLIAQDDGHDIIEERGGHNSLKFTSANINKKTLWLKQQNNDLIILINGANNSVTIKNYYDQSESKIDKIEAGGFQLAGSNIDQMVLAMSIFSSANSHYLQSLFSWHHEELQNKFNTLWREAVH